MSLISVAERLELLFTEEVNSIIPLVLEAAIADPEIPHQHKLSDEFLDKVDEIVAAAELLALTRFGIDGGEISESTKTKRRKVTRFLANKTMQLAILDVHTAQVISQIMPSEREAAIQKAIDKTLRYASDTAKNEVAATYAVSNEEVAQSLGLYYYVYSTSLDDNVRPNHQIREGKVFVYGQARTAADIPAMEIRCRCVDIPATLEELQGVSFFYSNDDPR